jgi:poly(3-hydroxybutyrate) depolymerase
MKTWKAAALIASLSWRAFAAEPLPALGAEASRVTVSGLSSGGYMAVQLHVAHSAIVKGAGVIAGGPYYCAKGSVWTAYYNCSSPGGAVPVPPIELLHAEAEAQAKAGRADPTANLAAGRAWLFGSANDRVVSRDVVEALNGFYARYKVKTVIVRDKTAGHAMPTLDAITTPPASCSGTCSAG